MINFSLPHAGEEEFGGGFALFKEDDDADIQVLTFPVSSLPSLSSPCLRLASSPTNHNAPHAQISGHFVGKADPDEALADFALPSNPIYWSISLIRHGIPFFSFCICQ